MTAVSGASLRTGESYWELSGPIISNRLLNCRACKKHVNKGEQVMCRDGRKLRFFYHINCFNGNADPRSQTNSSFNSKRNADYHQPTAPKLSSLEGPRAYKDSDGRVLSRVVYKSDAPKVVGVGKWSVSSRGYQPTTSISSNEDMKKKCTTITDNKQRQEENKKTFLSKR